MSDHRRTRIDSLDAEALTRVLGQLGHEVGTPLGSVLMMAEMLEEGLDAALARRHGKGLAAAAREIRDLVHAVVRLVRLRTGWLSPDLAEVDGEVLVRRLRASIGGRAALSATGDVPALRLDADYLADAVSLCCDWAAVRSGAGSDVAELTASQANGGLVLSLRCGGPAVPWNEPAVLDPLAAGDLVAARRHGGAALQLAVARMLVWRLGGDLTGRQEGSGDSVVRITVPAGSRDPLG